MATTSPISLQGVHDPQFVFRHYPGKDVHTVDAFLQFLAAHSVYFRASNYLVYRF